MLRKVECSLVLLIVTAEWMTLVECHQAGLETGSFRQHFSHLPRYEMMGLSWTFCCSLQSIFSAEIEHVIVDLE